MVEPGLYVAFFDEGDPPERHLPPVGPLVGVVVRDHELVAERKTVAQTDPAGAEITSWLFAELEFQRATGELPGGMHHDSVRIEAPNGVFLRFATIGDVGRAGHRELGPFATVLVLPRAVVADGVRLARRAGSADPRWELMRGVGADRDGTHEADIAFRTVGTAYHPGIAVESQPALQPRAMGPAWLPKPAARGAALADLAWPEPPARPGSIAPQGDRGAA